MNKTIRHMEWDAALMGSSALISLAAWVMLILQMAPPLLRSAFAALSSGILF